MPELYPYAAARIHARELSLLSRQNLEQLLARNLYHWCFLMRRWPMTRKARTKSEETSHRCYRNPRVGIVWLLHFAERF